VFVDYQNASDTSNTASRIVKYNRSGVALGSVEVLGRCDGMRWNPYTRRIWALVNNDGLNGSPPRQPALYVIDPKSLHATLYRFGTRQPHGGRNRTQLDETAFPASTHGTFYIADTTLDVVYAVEATFPNGSAFSEAALGAPVQSFVGALDPSTGTLTPLLTVRDGILDPTTLIFASTETEYSDS